MAGSNASGKPQFPTLNSDQGEIRLLEIKPGETQSPIECRYHTMNLNRLDRAYEALSYVWGAFDENSAHPLSIDNGVIQITPALLEAIKHLRYSYTSRYLWIDAICINQSGDNEKTQQVNMMGQIYTRCDQAIVWMGHLDTVTAADALALLRWLAGKQDKPWWLGDPNRCRVVGKALLIFMELPWWIRIWTVQEAILPPRAMFLWGHLTIGRTTLFKASDSFFGDAPPMVPYEIHAERGISCLTAALRGLSFTRNEPPIQLLFRWRFRQATDRRDKVYGLIGFRSDLSLPTVKSCDYTIDARTLFKRVTADLIRLDYGLFPLIGRRGELADLGKTEHFPSWAIDWAEPKDRKTICSNFWSHQTCWQTYCFTPDAGLLGLGGGLRMIGDDTLCLNGLLVDKVAVVESSHSDRSASRHGSGLKRVYQVVERWEEVVERFQTERPGALRRGWIRELCCLAAGKFKQDCPDDHLVMADFIGEMIQEQCLFVTEGGKFGIGPRNTEPGHEVWVVGGSRFPFLLKPIKPLEGTSMGGPNMTFVADCLVYGIMYGEAVRGREGEQVVFKLH
ncbi:unnamed protein product [Clonostachys rosea]|uniref:Heterokaryon incompatibility domain-containing protein n=1 Tax=Bionectria ochroleuca TaxID=29856 RepID=A0ABY6UV42_BIOOC|nr:unnamed protein product [Clonostachys rosea]